MYILGISCYYHDASAALLKDGKIVAAAEEERFSRKKHDTSFPINAISYCLKSQSISINDIAYIQQSLFSISPQDIDLPFQGFPISK